jgi:glycosyltransferase involved in cell wall biosynthesis
VADAVVTGVAVTTVPRHMWLGAISDPSGYTDELRGFLRALERCGQEPVLRTRNWNLKVDAGIGWQDREMFDRQQRREPIGPVVAIHQGLPSPWQPIVGNAVNVQRCMFETDAMPAPWLAPLRDRDEVWVPSPFNVETFARSGVREDRLKVLGGTLDFDLFSPEGTEPLDLGAPEGHLTFLTNFDFSERKGWRQLIRAWARAFAPTDAVCLVLKTGSLVQNDGEVMARIESFIASEFGGRGNLAPIRILTDVLTITQMPSLYAGADAYVMASRGEGWGRPYMEALAMGLPTIASNWSGNLAFMEPETSWLVDGEVVPVQGHDLNIELYAGHSWFEPDVDELVAALQSVAGDPAAARAKAAPARDELIRRFGPEATAARVAELAREAFDRYGEHRQRPLYVVINDADDDELAQALEAHGRNVIRRVRGGGPLHAAVAGVVYGDPPSLEPVSDGATIAFLTDSATAPSPEWIAEAHRRADRVWVATTEARDALVAAGVAPGVVNTVASADDAEASLATLAEEGLPLARDLRRAEIEARSRFAVYAPDWSDEAAWGPGLDAWLDTFTDADDVTLALYVAGDADAIGRRVMARLAERDQSSLPDLALLEPGSVSLVALAASTDAVLTDGSTDPASRPELLRRARRIVRTTDPESIRALAEEI